MRGMVTEPKNKSPVGWMIAAFAVLIVVIAAVVWAYQKQQPEPSKVSRQDITAYESLAGEAIAPPTDYAIVMAPYRAPVVKVYTTLGDVVSKGDVLVELEYASAQAYYEQARQAVQSAENAVSQSQRQRSVQIAEANKRVSDARAAEEAARSSNDPNLPLYTEARIQAEQDLAWILSDASYLAPYQRQLESARQSLLDAQSGRKIAMIRSPISGTVLEINARPGKMVGEDEDKPVAVIVNLEALQVHAKMSAKQLSTIKVDFPAKLTFEKDIPDKEFDGKMIRITTDIEKKIGGLIEEREYIAIVAFKNDLGLVKPEMDAKVLVKVGEVKNVLAVPVDAVDKDEQGRPIVKVLKDGQWISTVVETGLSDGEYIEIKSGLDEGQTIQVTPSLL